MLDIVPITDLLAKTEDCLGSKMMSEIHGEAVGNQLRSFRLRAVEFPVHLGLDSRTTLPNPFNWESPAITFEILSLVSPIRHWTLVDLHTTHGLSIRIRLSLRSLQRLERTRCVVSTYPTRIRDTDRNGFPL
jgi:hypothetical protein